MKCFHANFLRCLINHLWRESIQISINSPLIRHFRFLVMKRRGFAADYDNTGLLRKGRML